MARFRETLWFKKGSDEPTTDAPEVGDADRPLEDRYFDDGSVSLVDHDSYGLHTGMTQPVRIFKKVAPVENAEATMQLVVGQMTNGRATVYAMLAFSMACLTVAIAMLAIT